MDEFVIGVDGSDESRSALRWAAAVAPAAQAPVRVLQAWTYPALSAIPGTAVPDSPPDMDDATVAAVRDLVKDTLGDVPAFVRIDALRGPPSAALMEAVRPGSVLCLGTRGRGGFKGMLLGSVSRGCIEYAPCPVVIVREGPAPTDGEGVILVGVDGSDRSILALDWAAAFGKLTGTPLVVLHAWEPDASEVRPRLHERLKAEAEARLAKLVREHAGVEPIEVEGDPRQMLVEAAKERNATLVVVGRRGTSRLIGLATGGVTSYLVSNSPTSVAVIPEPVQGA